MQQLAAPAVFHDDVDGGLILPGALQGHYIESAPQLLEDPHFALDVGDVGGLAGGRQVGQVQGLGDGLAGELGAGGAVRGGADLEREE